MKWSEVAACGHLNVQHQRLQKRAHKYTRTPRRRVKSRSQQVSRRERQGTSSSGATLHAEAGARMMVRAFAHLILRRAGLEPGTILAPSPSRRLVEEGCKRIALVLGQGHFTRNRTVSD